MVGTMERMQAVVTANKTRQSRARELNIRAGSNLFPVLGQSEIEVWLTERLGNAVSLGSVSDPDALQLPSFEEELVQLVVRENPEEIQLLGQSFQVTHRNGSPPSIMLDGDAVKQPIWRQLPDEGVLLPSGRAVIVSVKVGSWNSISDSNIPQLKEKVREHLNSQQWSAWSKPDITVLDITAEEATLPDIITSQYGACVVEGTPLIAFGTLSVNSNRYYQNDPYFMTGWYRNLEEATKSHDAAVARFAEFKQEERDKRDAEQFKVEAEATRQELQDFSSREGWHNLDYDLRSEVDSRRYACLSSSGKEIRQWIIDTKVLVTKVAKFMSILQQGREQKAKTQVEADRAEREELAVILQENGENLESARQIKLFAEAVEGIKGIREGVKILSCELQAPYGRARRQEAIARQVPGLSDTDAGYRFLSFGRSRDVDSYLARAVAFMEAKLVKSSPAGISQVTTLFGVPVKRETKK